MGVTHVGGLPPGALLEPDLNGKTRLCPTSGWRAEGRCQSQCPTCQFANSVKPKLALVQVSASSRLSISKAALPGSAARCVGGVLAVLAHALALV